MISSFQGEQRLLNQDHKLDKLNNEVHAFKNYL